jgi:RimJ/RimL family protein N-acetyltransferase
MAALLETPRLVIRPAEASDAAFLLELMNEPGYHENIGDRGLRTVEDAENYLTAKYTASYAKLGYGLYIVEAKAEAVALGICGFVKREVLEDADIGFAFLERFCGRGYGYESAAALLEYGRQTLGFGRVFGVTSAHNRASIRLLEKLGLSCERTVELPGYTEPSLLFSRSLST